MNKDRLETHKQFLTLEVQELRKRIAEHDTGHIHTAISVLNSRIKEIETQLTIDPSHVDQLLLNT